MRPFAKACIDAGADAFFGSGPHLLWGIEMYSGKPIFYSLGNFLFQYETVKQLPAETLAAYKLEYDTKDASLFTDKYPFPKNSRFWESVIPFITFDKGQVTEIELHPIVLGHKEPSFQRGTPMMATEEEARDTLENLAKLSKPFGTALEYKEGAARVVL
jgi:poly-gamma-glutamate synthesis protein (capsule biosynthesis protein)